MSLFHHTVQARTGALQYRQGRLEAVLDAGRHPKVRGSRLVTIDLRERLLTLSTQEILTDGVSTRVTAAVRWKVADPTEFAERTEDPVARVYVAANPALATLRMIQSAPPGTQLVLQFVGACPACA